MAQPSDARRGGVIFVLLAIALWSIGGAAAVAEEAPVAPNAAEELAASEQEQAIEDETTPLVGWLELSETLRDGPLPYAWVPPDQAGPSLQDVLTQMQTVRENEQYAGVVIYLDSPQLRLTQVMALSEAVTRIRDSGKKVIVFSESYDLRQYLLASAADMVVLQRKGELNLKGLAMEEMYVAGLLEKVGLKADLLQVGRFKGASDPLTRTEPSEEWSTNISAVLDDLYGQIVDRIATGRAMTREAVESIIADSWTMSDEQALARRAVDRLSDRDLVEVTETEFGENFVWDDTLGLSQTALQVDNPLLLFRMLFKEPSTATRRASIAVIHAQGPIGSGESSVGDGLFTQQTIGSKTMIRVLGKVRDDENIQGAILRIDSPGGSALASELIWQAIRDLSASKPVYVSIGNMAASGGYYLACAGDEIYVCPQSIVGSIGVVGGKIILGGLYEKLGIHVTRRVRGPLGDMFNSVEPFTEDQRRVVQASMERVYDQFTDRVVAGRGSRLEDVETVAQGRLFTGRQAVERGLADEVGTLDDAISAVAEQVGLDEGEYDVIHLPPPMSLSAFLNEMFSVRSPAVTAEGVPTVATARQVMGEEAWGAIRAVLGGLIQIRTEPVLALFPYAIVVR
jgi:protease-4